ncbi:MAG: helix-turn-helix transcriptional regulator [Deltaproteobacteria bacterium]|nr:helix-turn-helix transcriptional regulator [Deltaproteobacteria bacterium]
MPAHKKKQPFGKRLMQLRRKQKMSLKNLANETGVSRAMEIDSSVLLREEKKQAGKKSDEDYQKRTEDYTYQTLTPEAQHKHLKAFKVSIDPKSEHKGVSYQHLGEEFVFVLKGKIEVMVGENKNTLGPGASLHFNSSIVHKLRNTSKTKAELLVVLYTP